MAQFCLPKQQADKFIEGIRTKELDINKLLSAESSAERRAMFKNIVGEKNAKPLNALFESKMDAVKLEKGMEDFISQSTGLKEATKKDMLSTIKTLQKKEYLTQEDLKLFREDFVNQKLGIDVSIEEATKLNDLAKNIDAKKEAYLKDVNDLTASLKSMDKPYVETAEIKAKRIEYGESMLDMEDYAWSLAKDGGSVLEIAANILNLPRAAMATWDLSAPGRQGWGYVSRKEYWTSLKPMFESWDPKAHRKIVAEIISDPDYKLSQAGEAKIKITDVGKSIDTKDEEFMTNLLDKFPGVGGSQRAYSTYLNLVRFQAFKRLIKQAELSGESIVPNSKSLEDIIMTINAFTGAGELKFLRGKTGPIVNAAIWSPKKLQSTIQMFDPSKIFTLSPTARKEHVRNLLGMVGTTGTLLGLAGQAGAQIDWDPRSADFGKIRIGDTRFDVSGGNASYLVLWSRMLLFGANSALEASGQEPWMDEFKSSTSGKTVKLNKDGYKPFTAFDVGYNYGRNKLSPMVSLIVDWLARENSIGEKFEPLPGIARGGEWGDFGDIGGRFFPLIAQDVFEVIGEDPALAAFTFAGNFVGMGTQTYKDKEEKKAPKDLFK